ncbi:MAG: hypothetical protein J5970_03185 [Bacilli bacterium]|nr:hypothetical protein [Bacilli bacterium]
MRKFKKEKLYALIQIFSLLTSIIGVGTFFTNYFETSSTSFRLDLYNLKIDGSKIEKVLLGSTKDVACSAQR